MKRKNITAEELDRLFDEGKEDILQYFDTSKIRRVQPLIRRINVDFPYWMIHALDDEAERLGVTRQSVIKAWIAEMIERRQAKAAAAPDASARRRQVAEPPTRYRAKKRRR